MAPFLNTPLFIPEILIHVYISWYCAISAETFNSRPVCTRPKMSDFVLRRRGRHDMSTSVNEHTLLSVCSHVPDKHEKVQSVSHKQALKFSEDSHSGLLTHTHTNTHTHTETERKREVN